MTTMNKKWHQALITTSSLLKLANHTEEIYTHVNLSVSMMKTNLRHSICINYRYFIAPHSMIYTSVYKNERMLSQAHQVTITIGAVTWTQGV